MIRYWCYYGMSVVKHIASMHRVLFLVLGPDDPSFVGLGSIFRIIYVVFRLLAYLKLCTLIYIISFQCLSDQFVSHHCIIDNSKHFSDYVIIVRHKWCKKKGKGFNDAIILYVALL